MSSEKWVHPEEWEHTLDGMSAHTLHEARVLFDLLFQTGRTAGNHFLSEGEGVLLEPRVLAFHSKTKDERQVRVSLYTVLFSFTPRAVSFEGMELFFFFFHFS